jgi:hypothetical protein
MLTSHPQTRDRCRVCGLDLPAWLSVAKRPDGAMSWSTSPTFDPGVGSLWRLIRGWKHHIRMRRC